MEDNLQLIIYVIFGIIYVIFGALKKRRKEQTDRTPPLFDEEEMTPSRPARQVPEQRSMEEYEESSAQPGSLEELLERYDQAARRAKGRAAEKLETVQEQVDEEFIPVAPRQPVIKNMEAEALEQMQRTERLKALQEDLTAKDRVEILKKQPHLEIKPKRTKEKAHFKPYEKKTRETPILDQVRQMAKSRRGMQKAVILTEILNRKHF